MIFDFEASISFGRCVEIWKRSIEIPDVKKLCVLRLDTIAGSQDF